MAISKHQNFEQKTLLFSYKEIVENINSPVFIKNDTHHFLYANHAFFDFIGISKQELYGDLSKNLITLIESDPFLLNDTYVMETGNTTVTEEIMEVKTGEKYICSIQRSLLPTSNCMMCVITNHELYIEREEDNFELFFKNRYKYSHEILNLLPNLVLIKDIYNKYYFINKSTERLLGVNAEQLTYQAGIDWDELGIDKNFFRKGDSEVLTSGLLLNLEPQKIICQTTGKVFIYQFSKVPIQNMKGNTIGIITIGANITKYINAAKALKEREILFQLVLDNIPSHIFWKDKNSVYISGNKNFAEMAGLNSVKEIEGLTDFDFGLQEKEVLFYRAIDREVMRSGKAMINIEEPSVQVDGKTAWLRTNKVPLRNSKGKVIGILGTFEDITEHKKAESALRDSELRYRMLFEYAFDGIIIADLSTQKVVECNQKTLDLLGLVAVDELTIERIIQLSPEYQLNGKRTKDVIYYYLNRIRKEGKYRFDWLIKTTTDLQLHLEIQAIYSTSEGQQLLTMIFKDVTEQKEQEKIISTSVVALNRKNEKLEQYIQSNMQLENFAYIASHDLKTPLRSIISFSQLLKRSIASERLTKDEQEFLDCILISGKNMQCLINDLLTYSKVNTESYNLDIVNVESLLEDIKNSLYASIVEKKAEIVIKVMPTIISADMTKMRQLFQNLIANAIKFHKKNQVPIINLTSEEQETHWQFSVRDNGIGIKQEFINKIFLLFRKLHSTSDYEGTGIGLAVCKTIVEQHGGKIWVESTYGEGTTFHFTIAKHLD